MSIMSKCVEYYLRRTLSPASLMMMMMNFIPPGAKHLKGNTLFTSKSLRPPWEIESNKDPKLVVFHRGVILTICILSLSNARDCWPAGLLEAVFPSVHRPIFSR